MSHSPALNNRAWWLVFPLIVLLVAIGLAPLMASFNYSFQDSFAGDQYFWVGAEWHQALFSSTEFWGALGRTVFVFTADPEHSVRAGTVHR